jgi:DNA-binding CsgD family transcriptional regulator
MVIPDEGYNRQLVELWSQGYKGPEIALRFSYSPRTIYNRLSELRKIYGVTIVPLKIKRKKTKNKVNPVN